VWFLAGWLVTSWGVCCQCDNHSTSLSRLPFFLGRNPVRSLSAASVSAASTLFASLKGQLQLPSPFFARRRERSGRRFVLLPAASNIQKQQAGSCFFCTVFSVSSLYPSCSKFKVLLSKLLSWLVYIGKRCKTGLRISSSRKKSGW
jgi:hypothetical protein